MKRLLLLFSPFVLCLTGFTGSASALGSYVYTYSTLDYDSATDTVTGYAYTTHPTGGGSLYYEPIVTAVIYDEDGNYVTDGYFQQTEGGSAEINLQASGSGCQYYRMVAFHALDVYHYVTHYPRLGGYEDGWNDISNFTWWEGYYPPSPWPDNVSFFANGPTVIRQDEVIGIQQREISRSGNCTPTPPTVTITPFSVVGKGQSRDITLGVSNNPHHRPVFLSIGRTTGNSGAASLTGDTYTNANNANVTFHIQGDTESDVKDNMSLTATNFDAQVAQRSFSVAKVQIVRSIGGPTPTPTPTDIAGTTTTTIVGEKINLAAEVVPSGIAVASHTWNIPGHHVKEFNVNTTSPSDRHPTNGHSNPTVVNQNQTSFIWVDGNSAGSNREVDYSAVIANDSNYTVGNKAFFNVQKVTTGFTGRGGTTDIFSNYLNGFSWMILYPRSGNTVGMKADRGSTQIPAGYSGHFQFVQVVSSVAVSGTYLGGGNYSSTRSGLDACYPYILPSTSEVTVKDTPGAPLEDAASVVQTVTYDGSFSMWLMFKPDTAEADWVPLYVIGWQWKGQSDLISNSNPHAWTPTQITNPGDQNGNLAGSATTDYPSWTQITVPNDPCSL